MWGEKMRDNRLRWFRNDLRRKKIKTVRLVKEIYMLKERVKRKTKNRSGEFNRE